MKNLGNQDDRTQAFWRDAVVELAELGWPVSALTKKVRSESPDDLWKAWIRIVGELNPGAVVADKTLSLRLIRRICNLGIVNPYFVHLVRDPRAVCYSYLKKESSALQQAITWNRRHREIESFLAGRANSTLVRYEDLTAEPDSCVKDVLKRAGDCFGVDLLSGVPGSLATVKLNDLVFQNVIFSGNRIHTDEGRQDKVISLDESYRTELSTSRWAAITMLAFPTLRRFDYAIGRRVGSRGLGN